jgi:hypothetical protein
VTWRIPPIGFCATCLIAFQEEKVATTLFKGTSLCTEHLLAVLKPELDAAIEEYEAEQGHRGEELVECNCPIIRRSCCPDCGGDHAPEDRDHDEDCPNYREVKKP